MNTHTHSRPSHRDVPMKFALYERNINLCPIHIFKECLVRRRRAATINITKNVFVTYLKAIREAHKETISRWVIEIMRSAGINVSILKIHSYCSVSSSAAKM